MGLSQGSWILFRGKRFYPLERLEESEKWRRGRGRLPPGQRYLASILRPTIAAAAPNRESVSTMIEKPIPFFFFFYLIFFARFLRFCSLPTLFAAAPGLATCPAFFVGAGVDCPFRAPR